MATWTRSPRPSTGTATPRVSTGPQTGAIATTDRRATDLCPLNVCAGDHGLGSLEPFRGNQLRWFLRPVLGASGGAAGLPAAAARMQNACLSRPFARAPRATRRRVHRSGR